MRTPAMSAALILSLAAGCAAVPECVTPCGARVVGPGAPPCAVAGEAEAKAMGSMAPYGLRCGLKGVTINFVDTVNFDYPGTRVKVSGLTYCQLSYILLGDARTSISSTAYAHEMMHAAECLVLGATDNEHTTWTEAKRLAVERAR